MVKGNIEFALNLGTGPLSITQKLYKFRVTPAIKSFRNLDHVIASNLGQANTYDVLWAETVIMSQGTLALGQTAPRGTEEHATQSTVDDKDAEVDA